MWVFDATPLIYLAKTDHLDLVTPLDDDCVIPRRVYAEVVETGIKQGYPDARRIERSVETGSFAVVEVDETNRMQRLRENTHLSNADVTVLAHASTENGTAVMDETYGRDVAATEGITTRGTAYLILLRVSWDILAADTARTAIDAMVDAGWYCAPDMYAKIIQKLDALAD